MSEQQQAADGRDRLRGMFVKLILVSLIAAIIMYLTLSRNPGNQSTSSEPAGQVRRTSRRTVRVYSGPPRL